MLSVWLVGAGTFLGGELKVVLLLRLAIGDGGLGLDLAASSCSGSESESESSTYSLDLGVTPLRPPLNPQKEEEFKQKKSQS